MKALRRRGLQVGVIVLVAIVLTVSLVLAHGLTMPPEHYRLDDPAPAATSQFPGMPEAVWYRIPLPPQASPTRLALYMPNPMADILVRVNGRDLTPDQPFGQAGNLSQFYPRFVPLPAEALAEAGNELLLRVYQNRSQLPMPATYLGPEEELRQAYERRHWLKITLTWAVILAMLTIAAVMGMLWLHRRHESFYGWVALAQIMGTFRLAYFSVETIPLPLRIWDWLSAVNFSFWTVATAIFVLRYLSEQHRRLERSLIGATLAVNAGMLLLSDSLYYTLGVGLLYTLLFVIWCYSIIRLLLVVARGGGADGARAMLFAGVLLMGLATHDLLLVLGMTGSEQGIYLPYGVAVGLLVLSWTLLRRFLRALEDSERLSADLERRVSEKHRELQENYQRLRQLESEKLLAEERARIMRDMHDGVGGQLMNLLAAAEVGDLDSRQMTDGLSSTMEELQLMIHSLGPYGNDLGPALGLLRQRLARACQLRGVQLRWRLDPRVELPALGAERTLHLIRIVQEAVSNALKHAHASSIAIRAGLLDDGSGGAYLAVVDDGRGLSQAEGREGGGMGLRNMARRAELAHIELEIDSGVDGTTVRMRIPVAAARPEPIASSTYST